jgi:N-acetylglutamate synthase-like GNAT family acetyltransferase
MNDYFRVFEERDAKKCSNLIKKSLNADKDLDKKTKSKILSDHAPLEMIKKAQVTNYYILSRKNFFGETILAIGGFKKSGEVKTMYSNVNFRGEGYGKKMMLYLEEEAKKIGIKQLFLWSSPKAIDFYKKMGFQNKNKEDTTRLVKQIS